MYYYYLLRDGNKWEKGDRRVKPQRPRLPWTAARTTKCYGSVRPALHSKLLHHAIAVPTAMQNRVTRTMSVAPPLGNNWSKRSPNLAQLHCPALDLFWVNFFVRVQLTSLLLILPGLCPLIPSLWYYYTEMVWINLQVFNSKYQRFL